jgi:hypothetical protein
MKALIVICSLNEGPVKLPASTAEKNEGTEKKQEGVLMGIDEVE